MINKMPTFMQYELNRGELLESAIDAIKKKLNIDVEFGVMDWEDGGFTFFIEESFTSEQAVELVKDHYGSIDGGEFTNYVLEDVFGVKDSLNTIKSYQDSSEGHEIDTYYVSVRLSAVNRYKEAWAQSDAIHTTLDCMDDEEGVLQMLNKRAVAVCRLIGELVPEDMSDYEPAEDPAALTNEKGELVI